jgi:Tfp pilus assembly protein PilN
MPADARDRRMTAAGDSGASLGVYFLLGGLTVLALSASIWTVTNNQITSRNAELERISAATVAAEARAGASAPYQSFATLAKDRIATVTALSDTRFDWGHGLGEISRVLPADVWLTTLDGASGSTAAAPTPTTSAAPAPTFDITGCTHSQEKVALLMARLRTIDRVRKVVLKSSTKPDTSSDEGCPAGADSDPTFAITISFSVPGAPKGTLDAIGQVVDAAPAPGVATAAPTATTAAPAEPPAPTPAAPPAPAPAAPATAAPAGQLR